MRDSSDYNTVSSMINVFMGNNIINENSFGSDLQITLDGEGKVNIKPGNSTLQ